MTFEGLWNLSEFLLEGTRSFSLVRELERSVKKGMEWKWKRWIEEFFFLSRKINVIDESFAIARGIKLI